MNGLIPDIGGLSVGESGCDGVLSGIDAEMLVAVGGGLRTAMEISSAWFLVLADACLGLFVLERILASSSGVTRGVGKGLLTHK
jgi:hypothetical protein